RKEADRFNHDYVGTEHLLLGIITLGQGTGITVLLRMGIDLEKMRVEIEKQVRGSRETRMVGNIPYTPRVKKVLTLAGKESKSLNHSYVGTEHILLGLLKEGEGIAARVLQTFGVEIEHARTVISRELDPNYIPEQQTSGVNQETRREIKTPALRAFGRDLTAKARKQELKVTGRDQDVDRIVRILARSKRNNPVLIGAPRIGKSSLIHALAASMVGGKWNSAFADRRIIQLDIPLITAGTKYRGQMEERIKALLDEVRRVQNVILVIDDLPTVISDENEYTVLNFMRPELSAVELQCIFTAHEEEFHSAMRKARWLEALIHPLPIESTSQDATLEVLRCSREKFEAAHKVTI